MIASDDGIHGLLHAWTTACTADSPSPLQVEPSCGVNARQPIDVREEAALRPRLESMALELLQRAALHAADFNLSPRTLGLTIALRRPLGGEGGGGGDVEGSFERGRSARLRPRVVEALASGDLRYSDLLTSRQMADAVGSVVEQSFLLMREAASSALPPSARTDTPRLVKHLTLSLGGFEAATPEAGGMMDIRKMWARGAPPSPDKSESCYCCNGGESSCLMPDMPMAPTVQGGGESGGGVPMGATAPGGGGRERALLHASMALMAPGETGGGGGLQDVPMAPAASAGGADEESFVEVPRTPSSPGGRGRGGGCWT